jgi:hypothetical protein
VQCSVGMGMGGAQVGRSAGRAGWDGMGWDGIDRNRTGKRYEWSWESREKEGIAWRWMGESVHTSSDGCRMSNVCMLLARWPCSGGGSATADIPRIDGRWCSSRCSRWAVSGRGACGGSRSQTTDGQTEIVRACVRACVRAGGLFQCEQ